VTDRVDAERLAGAWSTAMDLREQIAATAVSIADTEDWIAETLDHLARVRPHDAERLRARAAHARLFAARERAQAAIYRSCAGPALLDGRHHEKERGLTVVEPAVRFSGLALPRTPLRAAQPVPRGKIDVPRGEAGAGDPQPVVARLLEITGADRLLDVRES
jgi:hypothetical protein